MTTMKRPLTEYHDLEPAMDYWLAALGLEDKMTPGVRSQLEDLFRTVYDNAHAQGFQAGVRMVKNAVADIREG